MSNFEFDAESVERVIIRENDKAVRLLRRETEKEFMTTKIDGVEVEDLFGDISCLWF